RRRHAEAGLHVLDDFGLGAPDRFRVHVRSFGGSRGRLDGLRQRTIPALRRRFHDDLRLGWWRRTGLRRRLERLAGTIVGKELAPAFAHALRVLDVLSIQLLDVPGIESKRTHDIRCCMVAILYS